VPCGPGRVSLPQPRGELRGELVGIIDANFPYGTIVKLAGDVCGPALAEHGKEFLGVADIPGWRDYDFPELRGAAPG
jgi:hypothetical protein